ncbi:hypothetical protein [Phytohabitans rumicis]|uniref:Ferric oxidoreductase domain-containing protein n=1 Tax=Phytohabitans rumicis TaxID=1076125 RepID=A0A6V8L6E4_9ACTN|nr:hypothetical protein [Phytohabitans rumicis]GFJ92803.1 hypothetical protein Prum_064450 [Phytohabitans rumicis]
MLKRKYEERSAERMDDTETVETSSSATGSRRKFPRLPLLGAVGFLALAMWAASTTFGGALASVYVFAFLNFFAGVFTLVALSLTVMGGLVATDRFFLKIGHRVFFQGLHRATAIIAIVFLGLHISMKVLSGSATLIDPFVPFANLANPLYVGLGTIASYLMVSVFWTGIIRAKFAGSGKPWMWRTLHSGAYLAWPAALGHGLNAGRDAKTWVVLSYGACIVGVVIALLVRLYVTLGRRTNGPKVGPTAVGVNVETALIPRVGDNPFRREQVSESLVESTRENRVARQDREEMEPAAATRVAPRQARSTGEPSRARPPAGQPSRAERRGGYATPVSAPAAPAEDRWNEPVVSRAEPEPPRRSSRSDGRPPRSRERVEEPVSRSQQSRRSRSDERRSRLEALDERAEERRERERVDVDERLGELRRQERRGRSEGMRREQAEAKRGLTQWRRRGRSEDKQREAENDREWYESLRGGSDDRSEPTSGARYAEPTSGGRYAEPTSGEGYAPASAAPYVPPPRSESRDSRRERPADRWASPGDERYGEAPVSAPAARYEESRYDYDAYEDRRVEEESPRRGRLRLVTDDEDRSSRRSRSESRHSRTADEDQEPPRRSRRTGEYDSEPGYGRPGPYPPAVDPAPSRRARRSAPDVIDSSDRSSRRGQRAAGGEDLDLGDGAYWTRPKEGYGR